jgi:hypothetical protein
VGGFDTLVGGKKTPQNGIGLGESQVWESEVGPVSGVCPMSRAGGTAGSM